MTSNSKVWIGFCLLVCAVAAGCARQATVDLAQSTPVEATWTPLPAYTRASSAGAVATSTSTATESVADTPLLASPTAAPPTATPAPPTDTPGPGTPTAPPPTSTPTATATSAAAVTATPTEAPPTPTATTVAVLETDGRIVNGEYAHQIEGGGVTFHWRTDDTYLYGALSGYTLGWLSIGIEPEEQMRGANYVFGYVQGSRTYVADMYGAQPFGPNSHPPDTDLGGSDDIIDYGGREIDGFTVIEFMIPLDSGDPYDKALFPGERYDVILAVGDQDSFDSYHVSRAWAEIILD
ncbi:MAG: hypothetical protein JXA09_00955 [Anaerolineae bacterium]|nr:hypothetical protein [Anaerolineae bacterium]